MIPPDDPRLDEVARRLSGPGKPTWQDQKAFLSNPLVRLLAVGLDIDLAALDAQHREMRESTAALIQAAIWFGPLGWTVSGRQLKTTDYIEAVRLWEKTPEESAIDDFLTRAWAEADHVWLRMSFGPMTTLAGRHERTRDLLLERNRLLYKALEHHEHGDYEASTMIVLAQIDGLTFDFTENEYGFFYRGKDHFFEDDATLAGMPEFLKTVRRSVNRNDDETSLSAAFRRHPIMHGRYPAFGTKTNSTKAFALLAGVLEWLKPKAALRTEKWQAEDEVRYAGSKERDEFGKRRDRRGFSETRDSMEWLAIAEANEYRAHGRYNGDVSGMSQVFAIGRMERADRTTVTVAPDGQSYWAWCPSDTDVCFGIAARDGQATTSMYADEGPPSAPDQDPRWVGEFDDPPPDWVGD